MKFVVGRDDTRFIVGRDDTKFVVGRDEINARSLSKVMPCPLKH